MDVFWQVYEAYGLFVATYFYPAVPALAAATLATLPLALIVGVVAFCGRRWLEPWARHALWTLVLIRFLLPASLAAPLSVQQLAPWNGPASSPAPADAQQLVALMGPMSPRIDDFRWRPETAPGLQPAKMSETAEFAIELALSLFILLAPLGSAALLLRGVVSTWRLRRRLRQASEYTSPEALALLDAGRTAFRLRVRPRMLVVPGLSGPATVGWWRPVILLPEDVGALSSDELRHVLWHELSHIARGDSLAAWLSAAIRVCYWWNPVYWLVHRVWLSERELACDASAVEHLGPDSAADYGRTLLRFMERGASGNGASGVAASASFLGARSAFTQRIRALAKRTSPTGVWPRRLSWAAVVIWGLVGLTDASTSQPQENEPTAIRIPDGAAWRSGPASPYFDFKGFWRFTDFNVERTEVQYDMTAVIERLRQAEPEKSEQVARKHLHCDLARITEPYGVHPFSSRTLQDNRTLAQRTQSWLRLEGNTLTFIASAANHEYMRRLLTHWREHGFRGAAVKWTFATTGRELIDLLPTPGGEVVTARQPAGEMKLAPRSEADAGAAVSAQMVQEVTQASIPLYVRLLSAAEHAELVERLQADGEESIRPTSRHFVWEGECVNVTDESQTPFVSGYSPDERGMLQPDHVAQPQGSRMVLAAWGAGEGKMRLELQLRCTLTAKVESVRIASSSGPREIQTPHVVTSRIDAAATLTPEQTLLIVPLRRDGSGRLQLIMASAKPRKWK